jgi:hypothetical protein
LLPSYTGLLHKPLKKKRTGQLAAILHWFGQTPVSVGQELQAMFVRAAALIALLMLPAVALHFTIDAPFARYLALGTVFAFLMGVSSRAIVSFSLFIPLLYAAAAMTSSITDGVAVLIVAVAAASGAASSQGYHRGLFGMLAAVLIGAFEPATVDVVLARSTAMFAGTAYGLLLVKTVARNVDAPSRAVHPQTALSYAVLLAVLVLAAWLMARMTGAPNAWWLPLSVAALGEPSLDSSPGRAVARLAAALAGTLLLLVALQGLEQPAVRAGFAVALLLALLLLGRRHLWLQGFLLAPLLVLIAVPGTARSEATHMAATMLASGLVFAFTVLGKWMLWTLRPDAGRVHA